jgi:hypothetical protein
MTKHVFVYGTAGSFVKELMLLIWVFSLGWFVSMELGIIAFNTGGAMTPTSSGVFNSES